MFEGQIGVGIMNRFGEPLKNLNMPTQLLREIL